MSFDRDSDAELTIMSCAIRENNAGLLNTQIPLRMIQKRLVEQLAVQLTSDCTQITEEKYSTEYRLKVYVLTPDQLEKYVQRRAERLHSSIPNVIEE